MNRKQTLTCGDQTLSLENPLLMGVLNVTPDSFYDGGKHYELDKALKAANRMLEEGADILDIGGYSTRPGAIDIPEEEELNRVLPLLDALHQEFPEAVISIDTFRSNVAQTCIEHGARMINDVSGGGMDTKMHDVVAQAQVPYILMHMRGTPQTMRNLTQYGDLIAEMTDYFTHRLEKLYQKGVQDIVIDPGIGFAKSIEQNYQLLRNLTYFQELGHPVLVGVSRKSLIYKPLGVKPVKALNGTTALHMACLMNGAEILRVHDVKEAKETVTLFNLLR